MVSVLQKCLKLSLGEYLVLNHIRRYRGTFTFFSFNPQEQNYFSRSPVSSDAEAINVTGPLWASGIVAYVNALLALGFRENDRSFTPCPLGTFANLSTKGVDGCQNCPPGNF